MRKPKNYQYYVAVGKLLKKALNHIKHHNVQIDILCQLLCDNDLEEDSIKVYELIDKIKRTPVYNFDYHKAKAHAYERMLAKKAEESTHTSQQPEISHIDYYKLTENSIDNYIANGGHFKDIELKYEKQSTVPIHRPTVPDLHSFDEVNATKEEIAAYMDSKNKKAGCTFEEWKKTQLGISWDWEQGGY